MRLITNKKSIPAILIQPMVTAVAAMIAMSAHSSPSPVPLAIKTTATQQKTAAITVPEGLYVGYFQEDPLTNPEDPVPGTMYLMVSAANGLHYGAMSFKYADCQKNSIATFNGKITNSGIEGQWSGVIDNLLQSGTYSGSYEARQHRLSGKYSNTQGKQFRDLRPCIEYTIAPNGTWELFHIDKTTKNKTPENNTGKSTTETDNNPNSAAITVVSTTVYWKIPANLEFTLLSVIDTDLANKSNEQAITFQKIIPGSQRQLILPADAMTSGRNYIVSVTMQTTDHKISYSRKFITAQQEH